MKQKYYLLIGEECKTRFIGEDNGSCSICEQICPEVFEISGEQARVKMDVNIDRHIDKVRKAIENCPVDTITLKRSLPDKFCKNQAKVRGNE